MASTIRASMIQANRPAGRKSLSANTINPAAQMTDVCSLAAPQRR
jgi:hypothetical protein